MQSFSSDSIRRDEAFGIDIIRIVCKHKLQFIMLLQAVEVILQKAVPSTTSRAFHVNNFDYFGSYVSLRSREPLVSSRTVYSRSKSLCIKMIDSSCHKGSPPVSSTNLQGYFATSSRMESMLMDFPP